MVKKPLRIGIIGCGALGLVHAQRFATVPGVSVAAISDPSEAAMERVAGELPSTPQRATDYREILACGLDAVCISSPDAFHVPQVIDAFAFDLDVLCEKPLTPSELDLDRVIRARDIGGKQIALTYPRRYDASIRTLRDEIRSGRHGAVTTVTAYNAEDWITPNRGTWRHDPEITPGGFFYDASGHQLDTIFWVTGLDGQNPRAKVDLCGTALPLKVWGTAELSNGAPFVFCFVGDAHMWREQINIHCERADFAILNAKAYRVENRQSEVESAGTDIRPSTLDSRHHLLGTEEEDETADECFVKLIRDGGPNWSPLEDVRPVVRFTEEALKSTSM
jgi:predicted dehydrogenase